LIARDGKSRDLHIGSDQQLTPVAQLRPCMYDVIANSALQYLKIDRPMLAQFARQSESDDDISVHVMDEDTPANHLTVALCQDLMDDKVALPSLPEIAQKIQQVFKRPNCDADKITQVLLTDPAMTGKLIKVANSPLYQGAVATDTLQAAIVRLGMDTTYKLVISYALNELFSSKSSRLAKKMQELSTHSRKVAAISRLLAERSGQFDPEQAMLAGLVHDLGVIVILGYLDAHDDALDDEDALEQTIHTMRPQISGMLMHKWNFTEDIVTAAEECEDWFRNPQDDPDLCDLVLLAQYHSLMGTAAMESLPPITTLPAMSKLNIGPQESIELIKQSREQLAEVERLFH